MRHTRCFVCVATLMMSGTMSLPMSSFPNINSLLIEDDNGTPYLHSTDYLTHGSVISLVCFILVSTLGYWMVELVLATP